MRPRNNTPTQQSINPIPSTRALNTPAGSWKTRLRSNFNNKTAAAMNPSFT